MRVASVLAGLAVCALVVVDAAVGEGRAAEPPSGSVEDSRRPLPEGLSDLPLIEVPTLSEAPHLLAVIVSGDGGWTEIDKDLGAHLAGHDARVVGLNSLRYFWKPKTPDEAARALARILRWYLTECGCDRAIVIGYSFGADVVPFMVHRLPDELRRAVVAVALLNPSAEADFEFHVATWFGSKGRADAIPVAPEIAELVGTKMLCFYGEQETDSLCPTLDPEKVTIVAFPGRHHFGGDYSSLAGRLLEEIR